MTTIISRSALAFHGHDPAPDVHSVVIDHRGRRVVTWADVMADRRARQERILARKRHVERERACRIWVAYFDQDLYGGWHAFLGDHRGRRGEAWVNKGRCDGPLASRLMDLFPLVLDFGDSPKERFGRWMVAFARRYRRGTHHGRPRGCAFLWMGPGHQLGPAIASPRRGR
jgi:hypothetical protein